MPLEEKAILFASFAQQCRLDDQQTLFSIFVKRTTFWKGFFVS